MSVVTATVCGVPAPGSPEADRLSDVAVIAAPSNLGLRPPGPGRVPGCAKAPEALRRAAGLPAVDSPAAGGLDLGELTRLLAALVPGAVGVQVTVFDPDLDPDGRYARLLAGILEAALVPA
ncbi:hypothetical protein JD82_02825 [Prauserella rugosa]|uniref:Arginase n=1 Tax=Prauserella rugosa TaxID=43354 RepID=A0A660CEY6_9PSEU|nr:hypothetical protein JD82_02825 [Prauserella rugosa]